MKKYLLKPIMNTIKEGFILEDENGNETYKAQMTKFKLFGASPYDFKNYMSGLVEEHTLGKVVTSEVGNSDLVRFLSRKSSFKIDGENIWDYLHNKGIRVDSNLSTNKIGMTYNITLEGKPLACIATSSPKGKSLITTNMYYDVECEDKDLDLAFLVAMAIARTDQTFID